MQTAFAKAIHSWDHVLSTSVKLVEAAKILSIPVVLTTQSRAKLGETVAELQVANPLADVDKTLFSMCLPEVLEKLPAGSSVAIVGIESHICVTQTTLDLIAHGHSVYVIADGVSSCNPEEVPIALRRLAAAGARITTSESFMYETMRDAKIDGFKSVAALVKQSKSSTSAALANLAGCKI
ncbi:hypothetical protein PYCC9005_000468 [Savitreella phatthalungensis]